jgi:hypothetical protein
MKGQMMTGMMAAVATDVLVIGGGAAGIAAAVTARRNGAEAILVEAGPMLGGELLHGLPLAGLYTAQGGRAVGGFADGLLAACAKYGSETAPLRDFHARTLVCLDPEATKVAVIDLTHGAGVKALMYTLVDQVATDGDGRIAGVVLRNKAGRTLVRAKIVIDATDGGTVAALADCPPLDPSAEVERAAPLVFRMAGVDAAAFLEHLAAAPETLAAPAYPAIAADRAAAASGLRDQGRVLAVLDPAAPQMRAAVAAGRMIGSAGAAIAQTSAARRDVVIRVDRPQGVDPATIERAAGIELCAGFLRSAMPGFAQAVISAVHPGVPVPMARPVLGDRVLGRDTVPAGPGVADTVARGCHGTRGADLSGDGAFEIPLGCMLPRGLRNLLVIGGGLSADRSISEDVAANGTRLALGEAAGTAAALAAGPAPDLHRIDIAGLRRSLRQQGALLEAAR